MGEVVSELGFSPDPEKISAIHNMRTPSCKQDLQRLLGMVNYLAKYIPNMSELTAPLRSLLKCDVPWAWFLGHDTALTKLKSVLIQVGIRITLCRRIVMVGLSIVELLTSCSLFYCY